MLNFNINFIDGPFVENLNNYNVFVEFIDVDSGEVVYNDLLKPNYWGRASRKWFTNWNIIIRRKGEIIYDYKFDCNGKKILIWFDSKSLGDNIGWIPYVEEFRKKYNCEVVCSTFWNGLFRNAYSEIEFIEPGATVSGLYASYMIGDFDGDTNKNKEHWRSSPLQKIAADVLGISYKSIKPKLDIPDFSRSIEKKYVCIAIHSTLQCKYWNYPKGWQIIVNYFQKIGYDVVQISKEGNWYKGNKIPNRTIDKTGDYSINDRMVDLKHAEMFIGVSSGLAWLSWAIGIPTIIVSGVTKPWVEPSDGVERVFNHGVCNGCLNDISLKFERNDWDWCPKGMDFECSKAITPEMVIESINRILF